MHEGSAAAPISCIWSFVALMTIISSSQSYTYSAAPLVTQAWLESLHRNRIDDDDDDDVGDADHDGDAAMMMMMMMVMMMVMMHLKPPGPK
jgi:hypothetical protein